MADAGQGVYGWAPSTVVAAAVGVHHETLRTWVKRGRVPVACCVATRRLIVDWAIAYDEVQKRELRRVA